MVLANPYNYQKPKNFVNLKHKTTEKIATKQRSQSEVYLEQKVMTAKPEELTLMLYDGIIKFVKIAKQHMLMEDVEKTNHAIQRAEAIVTELQSTLDMDYEVSTQLDSLYDFMYRRLFEANISKDDEALNEVLEIAVDMRDTWKEAITLL